MEDYLYFIYETNDSAVPYVKIGISSSPKERLTTLQTGNPRKLSLEAIRPIKKYENKDSVESAMHSFFKDTKAFGEWFLHCNAIDAWMDHNILTECTTENGIRELEIDEILKLSSDDYFYLLGRQNERDSPTRADYQSERLEKK